jgi:hypothetical protein
MRNNRCVEIKTKPKKPIEKVCCKYCHKEGLSKSNISAHYKRCPKNVTIKLIDSVKINTLGYMRSYVIRMSNDFKNDFIKWFNKFGSIQLDISINSNKRSLQYFYKIHHKKKLNDVHNQLISTLLSKQKIINDPPQNTSDETKPINSNETSMSPMETETYWLAQPTNTENCIYFDDNASIISDITMESVKIPKQKAKSKTIKKPKILELEKSIKSKKTIPTPTPTMNHISCDFCSKRVSRLDDPNIKDLCDNCCEIAHEL